MRSGEDRRPIVMIIHQKKGGVRLLVQNASDECSVQLNYLFRGLLKDVDVIDADGRFFPSVRVKVTGIDWSFYTDHILGPVLFLLCLILFSVMVRVELTPSRPAAQLSLAEVKQMVCDAVLANPDFYTFAPPEEIVQRVKRARTVEGLIRSIVND